MSKKITLESIVCVIALVFLLWIIASFIDVNMHNVSDFNYTSWNLFNIVFMKGA